MNACASSKARCDVGIYFVCDGGTAANKAAATGAGGLSTFMSAPTHNGETFAAGDTVRLSAYNGTIRQQLTPPSDGTAVAKIRYERDLRYATPVLDGGNLVTGWTAYVGETLVDEMTTADYHIFKIGNNTTTEYEQGAGKLSISSSGNISKVTFKLTKFGTPTGNIWVRIYDDDSGSPGASLGVSDTVDVSTLVSYGTPTDQDFVFSTPIAVTSGNSYYFIIEFDFAVSSSHHVRASGTTSETAGWWRWVIYQDDTEVGSQYQALYIRIYKEVTGTNIWQAAVTSDPPSITIDDVWGDEKGSVGALVNEYDWYWASDVLYLYAPGDPDTEYSAVTRLVRDYCVYITGKEHVVFDGIEFAHATTHNIYVLQNGTGDMDGIEAYNCRSHHSGGMGFMTNGAAGNAITNLVLEDFRSDHNGDTGIGLGAYTQIFTIRRTETDHNAQNSAKSDCAGMRPVCSPVDGWVIWGGLIEYCISHHNGKDDAGVQTNAQAMGIWLDTCGDNGGANPCIVRYNNTHDNVTTGLHGENNDGSQWYGNVSYGNGDKGLWFSCTVHAYPSQYNVAYNNTCYGNSIGIQNSGNWGDTAGETSISNVFRNNIASGNTSRELKILAGAENVHGANGWGSGNVYTDNCLGAEANDFIEWALTPYDTYDAWEAVYEASSSVEADPVLENPAADQYWLGVGSPCLGAGVNLGDDFKAGLHKASTWPSGVRTVNQSGLWDMGAYVSEAATGAAALLTYFN